MIDLLRSLLLLLFTTSAVTQAWVLRVYLPPVPAFPSYNPSLLPASTSATIFKHGTTVNTPLTRRNSFEYPDLEAGSYLLTLTTRDWTYSPMRVDVNVTSDQASGKTLAQTDVWQTFWGNEWGNKGEYRGGGKVEVADEKVQPSVDPQVVLVEGRPISKKEYYMDRSTFSALSFLRSPMILMALFSLVMIVGLPYLMDNLDEEQKAELQEIQKGGIMGGGGASRDGANAAQSLQNFDLASWMAGKGSGTSSPKPEDDAKRKA
ncbi:MAG: hypothetical protein Q9159_004063 [Coniocarpon cinnabarinum]